MEGPSIHLASEELQPFCGKELLQITGSDAATYKSFQGQSIHDLFSWGKHLIFQFDHAALRVHFMLFGSYRATVNGKVTTGDYVPTGDPKLVFTFENGSVEMFHCSLKLIEGENVRNYYDFSTDILSKKWNPLDALRKVEMAANEEISDVLLDQDIFSGLGNVIRNESLWMNKISPFKQVHQLSTEQLQKLIETISTRAHQMFEWRKTDSVHDHDKVYRKMNCPECGCEIIRKQTGKTKRWSYYCTECQT